MVSRHDVFIIVNGPKRLFQAVEGKPRLEEICIGSQRCPIIRAKECEEGSGMIELLVAPGLNISRLPKALRRIGGNALSRAIRIQGTFDECIDFKDSSALQWAERVYGQERVQNIAARIKSGYRSQYYSDTRFASEDKDSLDYEEFLDDDRCDICGGRGKYINCTLDVATCCPQEKPECLEILLQTWLDAGYPILPDAHDYCDK